MNYPETHPISIGTGLSTEDAIIKIKKIHEEYGPQKVIWSYWFQGDPNILKKEFPNLKITEKCHLFREEGNVNEFLKLYPGLTRASKFIFGNYGSIGNLLKRFPDILDPNVGHTVVSRDLEIYPND